MKISKKLLALVIGLAVILSGTVFSTVAYLTAYEEVANVFTFGSVEIALDEALVTPEGKPAKLENNVPVEVADPADADRVQQNSYHMLPGQSYTKDPTMTIYADSEEAYVRMMITFTAYSELQQVFENAFAPDKFVTVNDQWTLTGTPVVDTAADTVAYEYRFAVKPAKVTPGETQTRLQPLFETFVVPGDLSGDDLDLLSDGGFEMRVAGHAVQSKGFADEDAAWLAFDGQNAPAPANPGGGQSDPTQGGAAGGGQSDPTQGGAAGGGQSDPTQGGAAGGGQSDPTQGGSTDPNA